MSTFRHKLDSIQVLRAIAVLLVVYVHTISPATKAVGPSRQSSFFFLTSWGCMGVDLFFVISGFIMTRILHTYRGNTGGKLFALKRAIRIIPLYWGLSVVMAGLILRTYPIRPVTFWKTLSFFPFFETEFVLPVIPAGWTLSYELYFYALIALVLWLRLKQPKTVTMVLLTLLGTAGFFVDSTALLPRFLTSPLLLEFALGVGCGLIYDRFQPTSRWYRVGMFLAFFTGLLLVVAPIFWDYGALIKSEQVTTNNQLAFWRSVVWGIPCALLVLGCVLLEGVYQLASPSALVRLGDASYSTYLLHGPVIIFGYKTLQKLHLSPDAYIIVQVMVCTGLSLVLYYLVEKPLTDWLNRALLPRKRPVIPLETAGY